MILEQPGQFAWQIFDRKVTHLLRDEYRIKRVTKVSADTLEALAGKLEDVDAAAFLDEMKTYNAAVDTSVEFNPNIKDGFVIATASATGLIGFIVFTFPLISAKSADKPSLSLCYLRRPSLLITWHKKPCAFT